MTAKEKAFELLFLTIDAFKQFSFYNSNHLSECTVMAQHHTIKLIDNIMLSLTEKQDWIYWSNVVYELYHIDFSIIHEKYNS